MTSKTIIHHFYYAAKFSSFSKAASFLKVSQPSVSKEIEQLEKEIGAKLFVRGNRGVKLTELGSSLYQNAEAVVMATNTFYSALTRVNNKEVIKIATQPRLYEKYLAPKLTHEFIEEHFIQIHTGELATVKGWMDTGAVDLVITEGIFDNHPIFDYIVEIDNLKFFWAKKAGIEMAKPVPTFAHSAVWDHWHDLSKCLYNNPDYKKIMVIDTPDFSSRLIERGMGIGLLPEQMILNNPNIEKCQGPSTGNIDGPIAIYIKSERKADLLSAGITERILE
ncbi:LysR family transcriptional regulator [Shewanella abyssi]|uniref:LysR family transcriptional regulator n=1 Tax=Shewanella abyssi TaxID=311789 RepID=UPI00200C1AD5|nr:LysR family transcriptional regulator [Shewanella abyssi]MCL1049699.1 LysR family transcriptional regulator [Shewanella abyssi]